jgi:hypothetical protein
VNTLELLHMHFPSCSRSLLVAPLTVAPLTGHQPLCVYDALFRLPLQETLFGGASAELLAILQLQVELLRRSRKYVEAEGVVTRALGICGAAYGPNDVQVAVWKNQLAQVCATGLLHGCQTLLSQRFGKMRCRGRGGGWRGRGSICEVDCRCCLCVL